MKTQTIIGGLTLILLATLAGLWLVSALGTCTRETLCEVEARTGEISRLVASAERALQGVFGGGVTINTHGVIAVPREIAELAVLEHEVSVTTSLTRTRWFGWFPSTLVLSGNYSGKLGIDLAKVRGGFDPENGVLNLNLPPARVLSIETTGLWRSFEDQSWFTPLAPYEVVDMIRRNRAEARDRLDQAELLRAADRRLRERLTAALAGTGVVLRLVEPPG